MGAAVVVWWWRTVLVTVVSVWCRPTVPACTSTGLSMSWAKTVPSFSWLILSDANRLYCWVHCRF